MLQVMSKLLDSKTLDYTQASYLNLRYWTISTGCIEGSKERCISILILLLHYRGQHMALNTILYNIQIGSFFPRKQPQDLKKSFLSCHDICQSETQLQGNTAQVSRNLLVEDLSLSILPIKLVKILKV